MTSAQRGYGGAWQKASKAWLRLHPIAVDWFGEHNGRVMAAEVVDHIQPHRGYVTGDWTLFWDSDNWQGLTKADHDRKTATEQRGDGAWVNVGTPERMVMAWRRGGG